MNHDLTTHAGQIANIKAVRARIAAAAYKPPKPKQKPPRIIIFKPEWKRQHTTFDAHILSWMMRKTIKPHIRWLKERCEELELSYDDMTGCKKGKEFAFPRFRLMWEMKQEFPDVSFPEIGRAFGGRDHTTALHGIRRWEVMRHEND